MLEEKKEPRIWKIIDAASKILIPVILGIIAWNQNSILIDVQKTQQEQATQLKLIEITWNSFIGDNEHAKELSMKLLESLDQKVAISIAAAISQDTSQTPERRQQAAQLAKDFALMALKDVKIDIYRLRGSSADAKFQSQISQTIQELSLNNRIVDVPKEVAWAKQVGKPTDDQIRYYAGEEDKIAEALQAVLYFYFPDKNFSLVRVGTRTPGTVSIVLADGFKSAY